MLEFDPDELHYTGSVGYVVYAGRSAEGYAALPYGLYSEERQRDGGQEQQEEPAYAQPWFMDGAVPVRHGARASRNSAGTT